MGISSPLTVSLVSRGPILQGLTPYARRAFLPLLKARESCGRCAGRTPLSAKNPCHPSERLNPWMLSKQMPCAVQDRRKCFSAFASVQMQMHMQGKSAVPSP